MLAGLAEHGRSIPFSDLAATFRRDGRATVLRSLFEPGPGLSVRFAERGTAFVVRISEFCRRQSAETDPRTSRCVESCMTRDVDGKSAPIPLHSFSAWA